MMGNRDYAAEVRDIVDEHMLGGSPLGAALTTIADGMDAQGAHTVAAINALTERVDELAGEVLPRQPEDLPL